MTSMPLTSSSAFAAGCAAGFAWAVITAAIVRPRLSAFLRAVARRDLLLRRVGLGRGGDERRLELLVGLEPVGRVAPLLAVPRVDAPAVHAGVVRARGV